MIEGYLTSKIAANAMMLSKLSIDDFNLNLRTSYEFNIEVTEMES